jgi:hypothetical protein
MPTVNLSSFAGAGAQFFTDDGVPLTGGLIYSYEAGTTTPKVTYTSNLGTIAHTNPIILNSAGRVPGGEIWLTAGSYKFVLATSTNVTIATYDNILGFGATFVTNYTGNGSTVAYAILGNVVDVYINGVYQNRNTYSVSGSTLLFTQAPPFTSLIEILYT